MSYIIGEKKRVFFISSMTGGAYLYRCYLPMKYLNQESKRYGCYGDVDVATRVRRKNPKDLLEADMVVYHRPQQVTDLQLIYALKEKGIPVVYSNDDTFKIDMDHDIAKRWRGEIDLEEDKETKKKHKEILKRFKKITVKAMDASSIVVASTSFLASEYRTVTDMSKVLVIGNFVDEFAWPKPKRNPDPEEVRIGLTGSTARLEDAKEIEGVLREIAKRKEVKFVIQGFQSKRILDKNPLLKKHIQPNIDFWKSFGEDKVEFHDYAFPLSYPHAVNNMEMDLMLIPRRDCYFNRAKSNLKFLEASMLKVPVVASSFLDGKDPYHEDIVDGENGFKAQTKEEWLEKTEALIEDKSLRREMGKKAYNYTRDNYLFSDNWGKWEKALDKAWK